MDQQANASDLATFIVAEVQKQSGADNVRAVVEKKIESLVIDAIDSAFRWGDTRKQIEEAVKATLAIDHPLTLPSHGAMIMAILRQKIDAQVHELVAAKLDQEMDEILGMAPKEVKLSEIIDLMRKNIDEHERYGTHMTCIIEKSEHWTGTLYIHLDPDEDVRKYDCDLQISVDKDGKIFSLKCDRKDPKTSIVMGYQSAYKRLALAAYCCGSRFIIDTQDPNTGIGDF